MSIDLHSFAQHGYIGLMAAALIERFGFPLLLTPVIVAGGLVAANGDLDLLYVVVVTTLAIVAGDVVWFALGRYQGGKVINFLCRISLSKDSCVRKTQVLAGRHAQASLLYSKWLPGVAHLAPPIAGNSGMSWARFMVLNSIGSFVWVFAMALLGWASMRPLEWMSIGEAVFGFLPLWLISILAANVIWKVVQRRRFTRALRSHRMTVQELAARLKGSDNDKPIVIDLRHPLDVLHDPRTIPGALNIFPESVEQFSKDLPHDREIALVCT